MKDILITTMPIKPQENISIGMCIAPIISELVSKKLGCSNIFSINLLHSYENKDNICENYLKKINDLEVNYDKIFIDKENKEALKDFVLYLYKTGNIVEKDGEVLKCQCGMVDIAKKGIRSYSDGDLYYKKNGLFYCKKCHTQCVEIIEKQLYLYLNPTVNSTTTMIPSFFQNELSHFYKNMPDSYVLISKNRDTGSQIIVNNKLYNIDIDLLWMNYIQCFKEQKQILIASNHQIFEMYIVNYINKLLFNKELYFIATPYMLKPTFDIEMEFDKYDIYYKKLIVLFSLKWRNKDCNWSTSVIKSIAKLGHNKRKELYEYISRQLEENDVDICKFLDNLFLKEINFQKQISYIKR